MKKLTALLLALIMVFSLAMVASAEEPVVEPTVKMKSESVEAQFNLNKIYTVNGQTAGDTAIVPDETLTFTSTPATTNPDTTKNLTIDNLAVVTTTGTMDITLPEYEKVGEYKYVITEDAGNAQGATYSDAEIKLTVLVTYDYEDTDKDSFGLETEIVLSQSSVTVEGDATGSQVGDSEVYKLDTFTNVYDLGSLEISKTVSGNLASEDAYFNFTVVLTSDQPVASDITISGGSHEDNATLISHKATEATEDIEWTATTSGGITMYTAIVNLKLKHDETVKFDNIPAGVYYTVTESNEHRDTDGVVDPNSAADKEYTVSYKANGAATATSGNQCQGDIAANDKDTVAYTNEKSTTVETGIALDSMPFVLMLAVAVIGMGAIVIGKKRYEV